MNGKIDSPSKLQKISKTAAIIATLITSLFTMANGAHTLYQYGMLKKEQRNAHIIKELSTFGSFAAMVEKHRQLAPLATEYAAYIKKQNPFDKNRLDALLHKYGNGALIYYSDEFETFRTLHQFYEELGLQVKRNALEFGLVFELVAYPTEFVEEVTPLCDFLGQNWFAANRGINGMCSSMIYLKQHYEKARSKK